MSVVALLQNALRPFWPAPLAADARERTRVVVGATLGLLLTALLCHPASGGAGPWLVAPLGASAVLVFGVPASPLAQPWPVVAGNTFSALVGVLCVHWIAPTELAAAVAVGGAIALMFALRCLHPPGGASALLAVLAGVHDWRFALFPVALNSMLLAAAGIAYNRATRRPYPHPQLPPAAPPTARDEEARALDADLDAVLRRYNQVLDVSRDDLKALLQEAQLRTYQRKLDTLRCADIMSKTPVTVHPRTPLDEAWMRFREHRVKALPVIDANQGIVGIVTPADFLRAVSADDAHDLDTRLRTLQALAAGQAQRVVADVMTRRVRVARFDRHLAELIPLFSGTGHHHLPIVDHDNRLVGMVTQSDVVAALAGPVAPHANA